MLPVGRLMLFGERGGLWSRHWTENRDLVSSLLHGSWSNQEEKRRSSSRCSKSDVAGRNWKTLGDRLDS